MRKLINFFIFILPFCSYAQSNIFRSNFDSYFSNIFIDDSISNTKRIITNSSQHLKIGTRFFGLGSLSNSKQSYSTYLYGVQLDANFNTKLSISVLCDYLNGNYNLLIRNYQDSLSIYYPGFGLRNTRLQYNTKYIANRFITIDFGSGKYFIGDGYQSLLLSAVSSSYPYFRISTKFGPVKYYNLYTTFTNPDMVDEGRKKHAAIHYLDFAFTPKIHFGVFESILWQSKSAGINRGYELAYFNPVIFYRPVEYSHSSYKANALMGATFNISFYNMILYGQFMLDDLNISRAKDGDDGFDLGNSTGFFQNKFGYQLGLKGKIKNVKYLIEYNQVQPYSYGHRTVLQNYSHMNQPLAHSLGANFKELTNICEISQGKWNYKINAMFARVGLDSVGTHYGQNIFASDLDASTGGQYSYGNFNGQGVRTNIFSSYSEVSYKFRWFDVFGSIYYKKSHSILIDKTMIFYSLGLRNFPFLTFPDY